MFYSAIKPEPNPEIDNNLPHITIQLPVFKESLKLTMYVFASTWLIFRLIFPAAHRRYTP